MTTDKLSTAQKRARQYFRQTYKPASEHKVGMEVEHICIRANDGQRISYDSGPGNVLSLLPLLQQRLGGDLVTADGRLLGLQGAWGKITLEPGNQIEWSSPARRTCSDLLLDLQHWLDHFQTVLQQNEVYPLAAGLDNTDYRTTPWVPKRRYNIMKDYYRGNADVAHRAMLNTAGIHINFDYEDAKDWSRKFNLLIRATPAAVALFANSAGTFHDLPYAALRPMLWHEIDPLRSRLPGKAFHSNFTIDQWADWIASRPLLLQQIEGDLQPGRSRRPDDLDETEWDENWPLQMGSMFTPVRTNGHLEVRTIDNQPMDALPSVPAFWTGLLYDQTAQSQAFEVLAEVDDEDVWRGLMARGCRFGMADPQLAETASELLHIAENGMSRLEGDQSAAVIALRKLRSERTATQLQPA